MAIVMVISPGLAGGGTIFRACAGAGLATGNGINGGVAVGVWVGAVRVASATAVACRSGVGVAVAVEVGVWVGAIRVASAIAVAWRFGVGVAEGGIAVITAEIKLLRSGVGVEVGDSVGVAVGIGVMVEIAAAVASTRARTVPSISGVGAGISVGNAAATIAWTVVSRSGEEVAAGVWPPISHARVSRTAARSIVDSFTEYVL